MEDPIPNPAPQDPSGTPAFESSTEWLRGVGPSTDVVLSSRVRLARNIASIPFASKASRKDREKSLFLCRDAILGSSLGGAAGPQGAGTQIVFLNLHQTPGLDRSLLVERHLISKQHSKGRPTNQPAGPAPILGGAVGQTPADDPRGIALSLPDERLAIMVNEEDHLRIQTIRSGLALSQAWNEIDAIDDKLESKLDYAFSPRFGYLTACPTNVGTGLRMSAMLHLPGLRLTGEIEKVKRACQDMSLAVRGFYGEGSEAIGDLYQISNQTTFGRSELQVLQALENDIIPRVIEYERLSRRELISKRRIGLEDQVFRAAGLLANARLLATEEAMGALSLLRLGVVMNLVNGLDQRQVNQLILLAQPAHLQRAVGKELDQEQRRVARASLMRSRLSAVS